MQEAGDKPRQARGEEEETQLRHTGKGPGPMTEGREGSRARDYSRVPTRHTFPRYEVL